MHVYFLLETLRTQSRRTSLKFPCMMLSFWSDHMCKEKVPYWLQMFESTYRVYWPVIVSLEQTDVEVY